MSPAAVSNAWWLLGGAAAGAVLYAAFKKDTCRQVPQIPLLEGFVPAQGGGAPGRDFVWPPCPDPTQYRHPSGKCMGWCKGNQVYDKAGNCIPNPCPSCYSWLPDLNACVRGPFC